MNDINERLERLQLQMYEKRRLENESASLESRLTELNKHIANLDYNRKKEQNDVDALESNGITAFIYRICGRLDTKIKKETQEAIAAQAKYEAALSEMNAISHELELRIQKMQSVRDSESLYNSALQEKKQSIKDSNSPTAARLMEIEHEIISLQHKRRELDEAISAGHTSSVMADDVMSSLSDANDMSTWDMMGGGLISDLLKHSRLDEAQVKINCLQVQLNRFKTELSDIDISGDVQINIDGFLRFADYFFDGFFVDWAVKDRIHQSQSNIERVKQQILNIIRKLENMLSCTENRIAQLCFEMESLIRNA